MRALVHKHPVVVTLGLVAFALAAMAAVVSYYLSSWLILPLI